MSLVLEHGSYAITGSPAAASPVKTADCLVFAVVNIGHSTAATSAICSTPAQVATALASLSATTGNAAAAYAFACGVPEIVVIVAGMAYDAGAELQTVYRRLHRKPNLVLLVDSTASADAITLASAAKDVIGPQSYDAMVYADLAWDMSWTDADATTAAAIASAAAALTTHPKNLVLHCASIAIPDGSSTVSVGSALSHVVKQVQVDAGNGDVPFEGASNYELPGPVSSVSSAFSREDGNTCNAAGVNVLIYDDGYKLWGDYLSSFTATGSPDADGIFVQTQRMLQYLRAAFVAQWRNAIDRAFTRQLKDTIIATEQAKLDRLVAVGALIGSPKIEFREEDNPQADVLAGHFVWRLAVSPALPLTSAKLEVSYTDSGYAVLFA